MKRLYILLCVVSLVLFSSCMTNGVTKKTTPKSIKVESVKSYTEALSTNFIGKVVANDEVNFSFRVAGTIEDIPIVLGESVKSGEIVALLDSRDYQTQLSATEAEYRQIKAEAERVMELYNRKSLPKNDYDKAISALERITAKLTSHRDALADCTLKAPINGKVQKIIYSKGETVAAGMPIISMISDGGFEVEIFVPSMFYSKMQGEHFCSIPKSSDLNYDLNFISILPKANANGLYAARFKIMGSEEIQLVAGMSCNVAITTPMGDSELVTVPLLSIFEKDNESCIWTYDDKQNRVKLRKVEVVRVLDSGDVILKGGVVSGEYVVVAGVHSIDETMAVKSLPRDSKTNVGGLK